MSHRPKLAEAMEEGEGTSEAEELINIDTNADSLDSSVISHIVNDILGFVLFMHQQIPSVLQDITHEFDELRTEYSELEAELGQGEVRAMAERRRKMARKREVRMGIRRWEKLMKSISNVKASLQLMIAQVPNVERVCLLLGPSPLRPLHVYELCFSHGRAVSGEFNATKVADSLSRRAIRTLISRGAGAGSNSYPGPTKLFLLVKAPSSLNLPLHFLAKREIRHNKKIAPFRLRFRCRTRNFEIDAQPNDPASSFGFLEPAANNSIWFQCRHMIKGLPTRTSPPED